MSIIYFQFSQLVKLLFVLLIAASILACGGCGSDPLPSPVSAAVAPPPPTAEPEGKNYSPAPLKLSAKAESSTDLFVEADFAFDSFREVIFDINATNINNLPLSDLILAISVIDSDIIEYDDPRLQEKSLLSIAKTDENGQIYISLELPQTAAKVLLELNALGMQNDVIIPIDDRQRVVHHFAQQR
jgi:hypothetical protein